MTRILALAVALAASGCFFPGPYDDTDTDDDDDSSSVGVNAGDECSVADDCPVLECVCTFSVVNHQSCKNGSCQGPSACTDGCAQFGEDWTGDTLGSGGGGGGDGGGGGGGGGGGFCSASEDCPSHLCSCPDGSVPEVRDCLDGQCQGADLCSDQCCVLGHGC